MSTHQPDGDADGDGPERDQAPGSDRAPGEPGGDGSGPAPPPAGGPYGAPPPPAGVPSGAGEDRRAAALDDPLAGMPPLGPLGKRLAARVIDALLVGIPVGILLWLTVGGYDTRDSGAAAAQQLVYVVVYTGYEGLMLSRSGQTVGKRLLNIRVAMLEDGAVPRGVPGWFRAAVYALPVLLPCCGTVFWLVNVLFCTWDRPWRQCVHDKAARTVVVEAV